MAQLFRLLPDHDIADLGAYTAHGGGKGVSVARQLDPEEVIELVAASGLRGRGGAGFPTGVKWRAIMDFASPTEPTVVVVNAAEGEPGTFKDRILMRRNPYQVVEGALIAAVAARSPHVIIAAKASFTLEIAALRRAIGEMQSAGWFQDISVGLVEGPSEYLFGEETGLLEVVEGRPPFPRVTPPWRRGVDPLHIARAHSAAHVQMATSGGSSSAPALVDNVETLANVTLIMANGVEWFRSVGSESSPGTIVCTVTGATRRHGVGEFALGTPVREVIETLGGGARPDHTIRAVLSGVSSAPLTAAMLDTPMTYEAMAAAGSGLGSASFIVIDDSVSMRWVAAGVARYLATESCGQCEPCKRDGLSIAAALRDDTEVQRDRLSDLLETVTRGARCALAGQTQKVVAGLLALDSSSLDAVDEQPDPQDADLMAIVPLVDIVDGRAVLDLTHRTKAPDWTYAGETASRPIWPIQRLADQHVVIRPPHIPERRAHTPVEVASLDPMAVVSALDAKLRDSIEAVDRATPEQRDRARAVLRDELHRHLYLVEHIVYPLLDRIRADGGDIAHYPDEHARKAYELLSPDNHEDDQSAALTHARLAVHEVELKVIPALRTGLHNEHPRTVASALALEASILGLVTQAQAVGSNAR
ncbi:MAG: NADH-ubiquinone oxidoreductase-F iron-sulfur binding region domain-containing protein [Ilumatobacteraceae bacterium]